MKKNYKVSFEKAQATDKSKNKRQYILHYSYYTSSKISQIETLLSKTPNSGGLFENFSFFRKEIKEK